jgi:hypothetical protein
MREWRTANSIILGQVEFVIGTEATTEALLFATNENEDVRMVMSFINDDDG